MGVSKSFSTQERQMTDFAGTNPNETAFVKYMISKRLDRFKPEVELASRGSLLRESKARVAEGAASR